jgi:hypothetical protein
VKIAPIAFCFDAVFLFGLFFDPEDGGDMYLDFQRAPRRYIKEDSILQHLTCLYALLREVNKVNA